jgi:hypothetical protein
MANSAQQAYLFYGIGWLAREFLWIRLAGELFSPEKTLGKVAGQSTSMV